MFKTACENKNGKACYYLSFLKNDKINYAEREKYLNLACEHKFPVACFNLARLEFYKKNDETGYKLLARAFETGYMDWKSVESSGEFSRVRESDQFKSIVNKYLLNGIR